MENNNILFTCKEHGVETYNLIKKNENSFPGMVYVWFKNSMFGDEKMWVRITKGNRKKGAGTLANIPFKIKDMEYGNIVKFKTNKEGITYGHK